jgi:hypothetical protein
MGEQKKFVGCEICEKYFLEASMQENSTTKAEDLVFYVNKRHEYGCTDKEVNSRFLNIMELINADLNILPDSNIDWLKRYFSNKDTTQ